ncbi:MAG: hypothetical protein LH481_07055 [Burkholderiales bacterium]|nr:hypothetical protein [Burkholderiales bacterium]
MSSYADDSKPIARDRSSETIRVAFRSGVPLIYYEEQRVNVDAQMDKGVQTGVIVIVREQVATHSKHYRVH